MCSSLFLFIHFKSGIEPRSVFAVELKAMQSFKKVKY